MAETLTIARPYAKAAFALADVKKTYEQWSQILSFLSAIVRHPVVRALIANQTIIRTTKASCIIDICGATADASMQHDGQLKNFVHLLADAGRLAIVPEIQLLYEGYKNQALNKLKLTVTSAIPVNAQQKQSYLESLSKYFNKEVEVEFNVEPFLLGGIVVRAGDTIVDFSLRGKLYKLQDALSCG